MDWTARRGADEVACLMVSPVDRGEVWGELALTGERSVAQAYYSDTRASATVTVADWDRYVPGAWLRLVHGVRGSDYSRTLFTGFVAQADAAVSRGATATRVELKSALYAMDVDRVAPTFTVGAGATARAGMERACKASAPPKPCRFAAGFRDATLTTTRSWTSDRSLLGVLFDLADAAGDRVGVDAEGVVELSGYVAPALRTATFELAAEHPLVVEGTVTCSDASGQAANRAIVTWRDGDAEVTAYADLDARDARAAAHVGYTRAEVHSLADVPDPATTAHAQRLAAQYLASDSQAAREWTMTTLWWEAEAGTVGTFDPCDGTGARKVLVKNVDSDLLKMTHSVTLKEV